MKYKSKTNGGITLIALVITIIILLILAGITISLMIGENGLLKRAEEGKNAHEMGMANDINEMNKATEYINKYNTGTDGTGGNEGNQIEADGRWNGEVNTPKLMGEMKGIYWDEEGKEVEVTQENARNWYNYEEQKWANAKTKDGSYWVWIPRYEYKITGETVEIKFIPKTVTEAEEGYSYVHPAFRDGRSNNYMNGEWDEELEGFWVAKYAAGFQASTTDESGAVINAEDEIIYSDKSYTSYNSTYTANAISQNLSSNDSKEKITYPVFKPLTYAYNIISTGDSYTIAGEIDKAESFYGIKEEETDSHMMKNSEWGAVAYLTQSRYGRNGEEVVINSKNLNNSSKRIYAVTGYEGSNIANGEGASSTKNRSGVYDLSGCIWEYVAGYITNGNINLERNGKSYVAKTTRDGEGYKTLSTRNATVYPYNPGSDGYGNNWTRYKELRTETYGYGDAVLETSTGGNGSTSWHGALSRFPGSSAPFFMRGGCYDNGTSAGTFAFLFTYGSPHYYFYGFRAVLCAE